ncbi:unnamed protein product, partial [Mesorhabditis spiculigera]
MSRWYRNDPGDNWGRSGYAERCDRDDYQQNYQRGGSQQSSSGYSERSGYAQDNSYRQNRSGYTDVYTDGACASNGQSGARAGWGVYWGDNHPDNSNGPVHGAQTNNRAELRAAIEAVDQAQDRGIERLRINTDSDLMIKSQNEWKGKWKENGWMTSAGTPVKNQDLHKELDRKMQGMDVKFEYVPGHSGIHGNEQADRLATDAAARSSYSGGYGGYGEY